MMDYVNPFLRRVSNDPKGGGGGHVGIYYKLIHDESNKTDND